MRKQDWCVVLVALGWGLLVAWVDSRPTWDDTGISAVAIFLGCAVCGFLSPRHAWRWALAVGAWIPLFGIVWGNDAAVLALAVAFVGAYAGAGIRMGFTRPGSAA